MKYLLLLIAIGAGYYFYQYSGTQNRAHPFGSYDVHSLSSNPMPARVLLDGTRFYAEDLCVNEGFLKTVNSNQNSCLDKITRSHEHCVSAVIANAPELITSSEQMKKHGKAYLECVLP